MHICTAVHYKITDIKQSEIQQMKKQKLKQPYCNKFSRDMN